MSKLTQTIDHSPAHPSANDPIPTASNLVMLDNYDSFTWNIYQYLVLEGANVTVYRNDELTLQELIEIEPTQLVISPGPGHPDTDGGISQEAIRHFAGKIPVLGVCMGQQCIFSVFGGKVEETGTILHGKTSPLKHNGKGLYAGLPQDIPVARYHSLAGTHATLPECLEITSWVEGTGNNDSSIIMGVKHKEYVVEGMQFHPESILTAAGRAMLKNFLLLRGGTWAENEQLLQVPSSETEALNVHDIASDLANSSGILKAEWNDLSGRSSLDFDNFSRSRSPSINVWSDSQSSGSRNSSQIDILEDDGLNSPSWKSIIRLSEQPWLQNHKVHGAVVYPVAGYICTVLRAAWRMAVTSSDDSITACKLRNVDFLNPLVIPETQQGVEVVLSFGSAEYDESNEGESWNSFTIASTSIAQGRLEHCRGAISIDCKFKWSHLYERHESMVGDARREDCHIVPAKSIYDTLDSTGVSYGPDFQSVESLTAGNEKALGAAHIVGEGTSMLKAIESIFQISVVAPGPEEATLQHEPVVPMSVKSIFVSGDFSAALEEDIQVVTSTDKEHPSSSDLSAVVQQSDGPKSFVQMDGIHFAPFRTSEIRV